MDRKSPITGKSIDKIKARGGKKTGEIKRRKNKEQLQKMLLGGKKGYNLAKGDNTNITKLNIELFNMPEIDLENYEQVTQRLGEFFALYAKYDFKPTVAGMGLALNGISRRTLGAIAHDQPTGSDGYMSSLPTLVTQAIKKAYKMMENMWETYMNSGKINPASGIFIGKNNYGYKDTVEQVITPNVSRTPEYSVDDIKERYLLPDNDKS